MGPPPKAAWMRVVVVKMEKSKQVCRMFPRQRCYDMGMNVAWKENVVSMESLIPSL